MDPKLATVAILVASILLVVMAFCMGLELGLSIADSHAPAEHSAGQATHHG